MRLGVREEEGLEVYFTGHSSLEAGVNLEAALMENAASSAIFVAVTSPAYVVDDSWTMRELAAFQKAMGGRRPRLRDRAFAARLRSTNIRRRCAT